MSGDGAFVNLTKGPVHTAIEVCVNDPANYYDKRQRLLEALKALKPPEQEHIPDFLVAITEIAEVTDAAAYYLKNHWFTWWSTKQFQEPILRLGIIHAIEVANSAPEKILPIDFLWLNIGKQTFQGRNVSIELYPFETYVIRSPHQVTCLLVTPPTPRPTQEEEYLKAVVPGENFWVVRDSTDSVLDPRGEEIVTNYGNGLRTSRLKALSPEHPIQNRVVRRRARAQAAVRSGRPGA
jgi:hypothetical protein